MPPLRPRQRSGFTGRQFSAGPNALNENEAVYSPRIQADELQQQQIMQAFARGEIPLDQVIDSIDNRNLPPPLTQVPFIQECINGVPVLLIPANARRSSFIVSNMIDTAMFFSYGPPVPFTSASLPTAWMGIPIDAETPFQEANGSVSINDIWVWTLDLSSTIPILGYEGTLAIENPKW